MLQTRLRPPLSAPTHTHTRHPHHRAPQARLEPLDLASFEPPTARRFALRQLEVMERQGMTKRSAAALVEREFAAQRRQAEASAGLGRASIIDTIQVGPHGGRRARAPAAAACTTARPPACAVCRPCSCLLCRVPPTHPPPQAEEEQHLQQALRQYADSHGPTALRQHAKELWQLQNKSGGPLARGGSRAVQQAQIVAQAAAQQRKARGKPTTAPQAKAQPHVQAKAKPQAKAQPQPQPKAKPQPKAAVAAVAAPQPDPKAAAAS